MAIPFVAEGGSDSGLNPELQPGMTLRDYFAAKSLTLAFERAQKATGTDIERLFGGNRANITAYEIAAKIAYQFADAMLQERGLR